MSAPLTRYSTLTGLVTAATVVGGLALSPVTAAPAVPLRAVSSRAVSVTHPLPGRVVRALAGSSASHADYDVHVAGGRTFGSGASRMTAPASNEKLLTTVTLLSEVGPRFHYRTTVVADGAVRHHVLHGDLVLRASGDPTLVTRDLDALARRVHRAGVHHVTGHLVVDDSRYSRKTVTTGWKGSFVPEETGLVDAFTVNRNTWRSGRAFDDDPTADNASLWRHALASAHVTVERSTTVHRVSARLTTLTTHASGPLSEIVAETLTNSDNFDAEMMLREAGAQRSGRGTLPSGIQAVRAEARALHVTVGTVDDGSGLSYADRESPAALLAWLRAARRLPSYSTLHAGLPVSCRTGTLRDRLCGSGLTGVVHAKTGTLDGVRALSGYLTARSGHTVTFSFLLSGIRDMTTAQRHLDAAVAELARHG